MRRVMIVVTGLCCALNACSSDDTSSGGDSGGRVDSGGTGGSVSVAGISVGGSEMAGSGAADGSVSAAATTASSDGPEAAGGSGSGGSGGSGGGGGSAGETGGGETGEAGQAGMPSEGGTGGEDCSIGEVQSPATPETLDLFGGVEYYAEGAALPAGRYRVTLIDGCMKYSSVQDWTIHAYQAPGLGWFLGAYTGDELVHLPGTIGYEATNGAYADFDACVAANQALPPVEFDFAGGMLGIWLKDDNYGDNVAGLDGRNPLWQLVRLGGCE